MAAKKRLIDAGYLWSDIMTLPHNGDMISSEDVEQAIKDAPTVDAVEVVRCKDCRYSDVNENHPNKPLLCYMTKMCGTTDPDWFCAAGERRDDPT